MDNQELTQRLARLSPAKRALLDLELKQQNVPLDRSLTIPRRPTRNQAPLSLAQRRLWFLNQLEPDTPNYNESSALRLTGQLDTAALQNAVNRIIARHEVLRATISNQDGESIQTIRPPQRVDLEIVDLRRTGADEREGEAERRLLDAIRRPFDLTTDLMLRPLLIRLDERDHILLLVTHHIASDGWSSNILWRELGEFYRAETFGVAAQIAELPIQYQDYADWQRRWFSEHQVQGQLAFWKRHLDGLQTLRLPTDRPIPLERQWRGARLNMPIDADLLERIAAFSRAQGVTQFMMLLAAFQVLLHRYCGQDDIAIGTPIAGRNRTEVEALIGFFVNTLILRTDLRENPTFAELLDRVRDVALNAYNNQDIPFEKLVEEINPQRSLSQTPLFNVLFAFQNMVKQMPELPGLAQSPYEIYNGAAKCDLYVSVVNRDSGPMLRADYDADLFESATVGRILRHYLTLLESFVADPDLRIDDAPLLSAAERHQLLVEWNDTKTDYPDDQCIQALFEAQADKTPDAVAVVFEHRRLTYRELNSKANRLARRLQDLGIGPSMAVGICLERSIEFVVGLLAILKSGGAYLPLDPSYPDERLRFMTEDAQVKALLTHELAAPGFAAGSIEILPIDLDSDDESQRDSSNLSVTIAPDQPAYIIYTSGSTGLPKGVLISHRAVNRLVLQTDYVKITPGDAIAQVANVSFDAATFEIWGALLNGARVVVIDKETVLSPPAFASAIAAQSITALFLTTALFNQMVERIPLALGSLRYLLFGGETANPEKVKAFLDSGPQCRVLHVYGPTETTTFATSYWVNALAHDAPPIGKPIANTTCHILDVRLNPVPVNVSGELYIGGPGVAQGYLNRPQLTEEKFIANPFSDKPGARLYRTGDLARYRADGNIEFLGRIDNQVKLRGFRVELDEIEAVMKQHAEVRDAAVVLREDQPGDKRLVAYFVARSAVAPSRELLAGYLQAKLPSYMIPAAFVLLPELPVNANGKIDRLALPQPIPENRDKTVIETGPRTAKETLVREIWTEVLGAQPRSIHDNFFELGGHSLLGIALVSRLQEQFHRPVPVRWLFESPSVAGLAARLDSAPSDGVPPATNRWRYLFELKPGNGKGPVFLCPGGFGGDEAYLYYARLAYHVGAEYSFYGLRARSAEGEMAAHRHVEAMAVDYLQEIRSLQPHGPYSLMGNCIGGVLAYEIARQLQAEGEQCNLVLLDSFYPSRRNYYHYLLHEYGKRIDRFFRDRRRDLSARLREIVVQPKTPTSGKPNSSRSRRIQRRQESYVQILRGYRPRPYKGRVSLIYNENAFAIDPLGGWKHLLSGNVASYCAPGNHETYIREHVVSLAKLLRQCLEKG